MARLGRGRGSRCTTIPPGRPRTVFTALTVMRRRERECICEQRNTGRGAFSGQAPFYHQCLGRNGLSPHCPHIKYFDPLPGVCPHDQRARDAALHRESAAIYWCFRKGAMSNTRAFGERNHATSKTALLLAYQIRPFLGLSPHKYFASLPRVRPHEQRASDATTPNTPNLVWIHLNVWGTTFGAASGKSARIVPAVS